MANEFSIEYVNSDGVNEPIGRIKSFLLFYNFDFGTVPYNPVSFYSAFLSVVNTKEQKTTNPYFPAKYNVSGDEPFDINIKDPDPHSINKICWKGYGTMVSQNQCIHSRTTLLVSGANYAESDVFPGVAGESWEVPDVMPQVGDVFQQNKKDAEGQLIHGISVPYHALSVQIGNEMPIPKLGIKVCAYLHFGGSNNLQSIGYVKRYIGGASKSGFDAILAEAPSSVVDNIFPAFTFPNEGETKIINEDRKKSDSNKKGFGIVAAGSFKKVLPLISPLYDKFFRVDCIGSFYNIVVEMLASLQDGTICTAESFDETIPEDPESDYPVEIVMFRQQKGGFEEMSEPK